MTTITREHLEDEVLKSIQKKAESIMPKDAKVILFGSRARRDAKADSDWDILVLLNKDKIDEQDHDNYTYPLWELGWQINQMIHPIVYSMKDWNSKKGSLGSTSARKPNRPIFTPIIGVPLAPTRLAAFRKVPSPPIEMT